MDYLPAFIVVPINRSLLNTVKTLLKHKNTNPLSISCSDNVISSLGVQPLVNSTVQVWGKSENSMLMS